MSPADDSLRGPPESRPTPDPTVLTTEQLLREVANIKEWANSQLAIRDERLRGIDKATEVLNETVNRVPTALQEGLGHITEVSNEKFAAISTQFSERDNRSERESRDNKEALAAALQAQKELANEKANSLQRSIEKSDESTTNQLGAATQQIDDLKERMTRMESAALARRDATQETRQETVDTRQQNNWAISAGIAVAGLAFGAAMALISRGG